MIYISGPITRNPNYKSDFKEGSMKARKLGCGAPINPALVQLESASWKDYMQTDIKLLLDCDAIYMLRGWIFSKGARLERRIAKDMGMQIFYEGLS